MNLILVAALALLPVYIFGSGGFQLVDLPVVVLAGIAFFGKFDKDKYLKTIFLLLPFSLWAFLVNSGYYLVSTDIWFFKEAITLIYDFVLLLCFSIIFTKVIDNNNIKYIYLGLIISIILCLFVKGYPAEGENVGRVQLSFNDPNQLGYFAAILLVYVILLLRFKEINNYHKPVFYLFDIIIISFAHFFLSLSISRSAIGAFVVLDICLLKNIKNLRILVPVFACGTMAFIFLMYINPHFVEQKMALRTGEFTEGAIEGGLADRVLGPINFLHGIEIFIGKGSGGFYGKRNIAALSTGKGYGGESHNIFFDALRSYGLVGICLLAFWFLKAILATWKMTDALFVWVGLLTYNMGNNGVRFRSFWIVLALLFALARWTDKSFRKP